MNRWTPGLLLLIAALPLHAEQVYRWVDAQGGVHYSGTPPTGQASEAEKLRFQREPDAAAAAATMQRYQDDAAQRREVEAEAAKLAAGNGRRDDERQARCKEAQERLGHLSGPPATRFRQPDGSYRRFTDEERVQQQQELQASVQKNCN